MKLQTNISSGGRFRPTGEIEVTLSRRNLLALLHKLDWEESERTIQKFQDGIVLTLVAEDDAEHYGDDAAGVMHPATERFIESYGGSE